MGGIIGGNAGLGALLGVTQQGGAMTTALQTLQLQQQYQMQAQNTLLSMQLAQQNNAQLQISMTGQNIATIFELQGKMQQTYFKTTKGLANGWIQALGGGGGG